MSNSFLYKFNFLVDNSNSCCYHWKDIIGKNVIFLLQLVWTLSCLFVFARVQALCLFLTLGLALSQRNGVESQTITKMTNDKRWKFTSFIDKPIIVNLTKKYRKNQDIADPKAKTVETKWMLKMKTNSLQMSQS